jgi:hypothetical protein
MHPMFSHSAFEVGDYSESISKIGVTKQGSLWLSQPVSATGLKPALTVRC